jgi:hypothetical protein
MECGGTSLGEIDRLGKAQAFPFRRGGLLLAARNGSGFENGDGKDTVRDGEALGDVRLGPPSV